uniref:Uncharacterized protein n=1 Tax=Arundo donax TaxID=35708 RepID=A0A0A9A9R2_ARUDO
MDCTLTLQRSCKESNDCFILPDIVR